jgi:hypothetical protein
MAGEPCKGDAERSILDAGRDELSCQLIHRAMPRARHEMPAVDLALRQPLAGAVRTSGFLERTAMDPDRICHGKSVLKGLETRGSDFPVRKPFPCSGDQKGDGRNFRGEIGKPVALPEREEFLADGSQT